MKFTPKCSRSTNYVGVAAILPFVLCWAGAGAQTALIAAGSGASSGKSPMPWSDPSLSPDRRADLVLQRMTLDEKLQLVHGTGWGVLRAGEPVPADSNRGAGFVPGIARLGIPKIDLADSAVGVRMAGPESRYATLLPSVLGLASSWDVDAANLYGEVIGRELRLQGFDMSIGGGVNLTREPRNGRNFEYAGEDPILAGNIVGHLATGVQSQHVMGDIKHYALNDQESGRTTVNVVMDKRTMRETDLLAFEIAIEMAHPAGVMCSYNKVNGDHTCESDYLLNQVLKKDFGFKGWVLSDWEATHSTVKAANAGLDQEMPGEDYFGPALKKAVDSGEVSMERLDDMDHRILRGMFASGIVDHPPVRGVVDPFRGRDDARHIAQESIVLLKNANSVLPLHAAALHRIAIIGGHADVGVLSGGGSAQVDAPGGNAIDPNHGGSQWGKPVYFPSSPMKAVQALAPGAQIAFASGSDIAEAVRLAQSSDVALVFATEYMSEGSDAATLALPENQDALIAAVSKANPRTVVVLETGGPVTMPWVDSTAAVLASWYPGIGGGEAIADLLFGVVNPSARLPITFPRAVADLPEPVIIGDVEKHLADDDGRPEHGKEVDLHYKEGLAIGYRWYEVSHRQPLFAFGYGLSYTTFKYSDLHLDAKARTAQFKLTNTGAMRGAEVPQMYVRLPDSAGEPFFRLAGWQRVDLAPGEARTVTIPIDPHYISMFDEKTDAWKLVPGTYEVHIGRSSQAADLDGTLSMQP
jgi:beta-glucosidase